MGRFFNVNVKQWVLCDIYVTNGIIEQELGFNPKKTFRLFKSLLDKEMVKKEGEKKGTKYFLDNWCPINVL